MNNLNLGGLGQGMGNQNANSNANANANAAGGREDYVDKALDKIEQKFGQKSGMNMDPQRMRGANESITDKARAAFEKATGKHIPDKVSN